MDDQIEPPTKKPKLEECNFETDSPKDLQADFTKDVDTVEDKFTVLEDKYNNFIHPDELEKLREFQVLDEVRSNDEDSNDEDSDSSDGKSEVPEDEIEKMLEEDLPEDFKGAPKAKEKPYITRQKVVLEEKGVNHFEVLPLDWMMVRHYSGMPVYMHRASRVCTLSKPYFLGKGNTRRHDIPISAIPCLAYRKALEEEEKQKEIDRHIEEQIKSGTWQQSIDKNKSKSQTTHKKTDGNCSESNVANCPYLHGQRVQSDIQIPNNHDVLMCKKISNEKVVSEKAMTKSNENKVRSSENITRHVETNDSENCDALIKSLSKSLDDEINRINSINYFHDKIKGEEGELVPENVVENPISEENSHIKSTRIDDLDKLGNKMAPNNSEDTSTNKTNAIKVNDKSVDESNDSNIIRRNDTDKTNDIPNETSVTNDNQAKTSHENSENDSQDKPTMECNETDTEDESNKNQPIGNENIVDNQELLNRESVVVKETSYNQAYSNANSVDNQELLKSNNQAYDNENTSENEILLNRQHLFIPETSNNQSFSNENTVDNELLLNRQHLTILETSNNQSFSNVNTVDNEVLLNRQHLTIPETSNNQSFSNENTVDNELLLNRQHLTIPDTSNNQSFSNENTVDNELLLNRQHLTVPEMSNNKSFSNENTVDNELLLNRQHLTIPETSNNQSFSNENTVDNEVLLNRQHLTIPETSNNQSFSNENTVDNEVLLNRQHLTIPETSSTQTLVNENTVDNEVPLNRQPVVLPGGMVMPPPRVETVSTSWKTQHLTHDQVNDYCKNLFRFKTVNIMHFKRWADRRKYTKARKTLQYPTLPEGTKLITIPAQPANGQDNGAGKASKRDWVMNMNGRSYLSVFHEYVRRALQKQPVYEFKQLENASTPYQATVYIGGMQYGVGHGSSKRSAKSAAARASIHILIPEMRAELDQQQPENNSPNEPDFSFFDYVGIEDPRITEFCAATCEPSPHAILRTCLLRNFGAGDKHIHTEMKKLEYQKIELTMKVGKHTATVVCKNKKTAKQRASQAILQALHPHVRSWGSLLRLYGSRSVKSCKEKKLEEQQITLLQDAARHNEPNHAVLQKLRHEMRKLRERDEAVVPIGTLLLKDDLPTHSGSNLNNVDL